MGVINKNIQEMKATAELKQLWKHWFQAPIICDTSDIQGHQQGLQIQSLTAIITLTCGMVLLSVIGAVILRIVWGKEIESEKIGEGCPEAIYPPPKYNTIINTQSFINRFTKMFPTMRHLEMVFRW
jgi:hypothetical protein